MIVLPTLVHLAVLLSSPPDPAALPVCGVDVERCAAVRLWVAAHDDARFDDLALLSGQLKQANAHHAPAGLNFQVVEVRVLGADERHVATRADRDALGHARWKRGLIDVYVVSKLGNVDEPGEIRGVHWRSRKDRGRRWVVLSRISPPRVLAHELGHYFGLAHSTVPASLMNTSGNALAERAFQPDELRKIERRARTLFAQGVVSRPSDSQRAAAPGHP